MSNTNRFEDLPVWQTAIEFGASVFELTSHPSFAAQSGLREHLRHEALLISTRIANGCECGSMAELRKGLDMARGSAGSVRSMLMFAQRLGLGPEQNDSGESSESGEGDSQFDQLRQRADALSHELLMSIEHFRNADITPDKSLFNKPGTFIPSEQLRSFISKLERFRAGAEASDVFGPN